MSFSFKSTNELDNYKTLKPSLLKPKQTPAQNFSAVDLLKLGLYDGCLFVMNFAEIKTKQQQNNYSKKQTIL